MFRQHRLTQVFNKANQIYINDQTPIVIMSDCHRGIGNWNDNFAHNENIYKAALYYYYNKSFTYIELGDGDELWENKNYQDIKNQYKDIFQILQKFCSKNRMHVVYGNHDLIKKKIGMGEGFENCCIHEGLILKDNSNSIFLVHGHQGDLINDYLSVFSKFLVKYVWKPVENIGVHDPTSPAQNNNAKKITENALIRWSSKHNQIIIAGHTHRPMLPKPGEHKYFNSGSCIHPYGITAIEIQKKTICLVKWSFEIGKKGVVYVKRKVLVNPEKLELYF